MYPNPTLARQAKWPGVACKRTQLAGMATQETKLSELGIGQNIESLEPHLDLPQVCVEYGYGVLLAYST